MTSSTRTHTHGLLQLNWKLTLTRDIVTQPGYHLGAHAEQNRQSTIPDEAPSLLKASIIFCNVVVLRTFGFLRSNSSDVMWRLNYLSLWEALHLHRRISYALAETHRRPYSPVASEIFLVEYRYCRMGVHLIVSFTYFCVGAELPDLCTSAFPGLLRSCVSLKKEEIS